MSNNKLNEFSEDFALDELESADSIDELPHNRKDEKELDERNKIYTKILYNYSKYLEETLNKNKVSKKYLINFNDFCSCFNYSRFYYHIITRVIM